MARVWTDTERKILDDDMQRNLRLVLSTHPTDPLTRPLKTYRFIKSNRPTPRTD